MTPFDRKDVIDIGDGYYVNYTIEYKSIITPDREEGEIIMYVGKSYDEATLGLCNYHMFTMKDITLTSWGVPVNSNWYKTYESAGEESETSFRKAVISKREQLIEIIKQNS